MPVTKEQLAHVDLVDLMKDVTLHVTVARAPELRWRVRLALGLLWLMGKVLNCQVKVHGMEGDDGS